jgi:hypothetical protein
MLKINKEKFNISNMEEQLNKVTGKEVAERKNNEKQKEKDKEKEKDVNLSKVSPIKRR